MTTIAFRDGVMAADDNSLMCGLQGYSLGKIFHHRMFNHSATARERVPVLVGFSGDAGVVATKILPEVLKVNTVQDLRKGDTHGKLIDGEVSGLLVFPVGTGYLASYLDSCGAWLPYNIGSSHHQTPPQFWAIGSGRDFALGAMHAGASARDAVIAASRFDPYTSDIVSAHGLDDQ